MSIILHAGFPSRFFGDGGQKSIEGGRKSRVCSISTWNVKKY